MEFECIQIKKMSKVLSKITLARPEKHNALSIEPLIFTASLTSQV